MSLIRDPEHPRGGSVRLLVHHLRHEALKGQYPGRLFAAAKSPGTADIPGGEIGPGAFALIFEFNAHRPPRRRRKCLMNGATRRDAGLLIRGPYAVGGTQGFSVPCPVIPIKYSVRLLREGRIAREYPGSMRPGANRILAQPSPQCTLADAGDPAASHDRVPTVCQAQSRQGQPVLMRVRARQGFNRDHDGSGEKRAGRPPRGRSSRPRKRSSKNRFRHLLTMCRGVSSRAAISSLSRPAAAYKAILALITALYDDVYCRAIASSLSRSAVERVIVHGLCLGILHLQWREICSESPVIGTFYTS